MAFAYLNLRHRSHWIEHLFDEIDPDIASIKLLIFEQLLLVIKYPVHIFNVVCLLVLRHNSISHFQPVGIYPLQHQFFVQVKDDLLYRLVILVQISATLFVSVGCEFVANFHQVEAALAIW